MKKMIAKTVSKLESSSCDCLVVFCQPNNKLSTTLKTLDSQVDGLISGAIKSKELEESLGSSLMLNLPKQSFKRLLLISLGKKENINQEQWLKALGKLNSSFKSPAVKKILIDTHQVKLENDKLKVCSFAATSLVKANYHYQTSLAKKADKKKAPLEHINEVAFVADDAKAKKRMQAELDEGQAIGQGINASRELGNLPGNFCTPSFLASQATKLAKGNKKISCKVLNEKAMRDLKMLSLLSVSAGSDEPAKLIQLDYKGGKANQKPIVLVGKGITFDSGGISLKPGAAMDEMKFDMCGAATVMGIFNALNAYDIPLNVTGIIAASENMPSSNATKPGDVITSMSGQTIEILNTDAEGRLVLCDALTYAQKNYKSELIIDLATLTGACVVALGSHASGLYSNDDDLAQELLQAGVDAHDRTWRMPLWEDYNKQLKSNFADLANIGGRMAGSVTAACFLQNFIEKDTKWAHLDIAGIAWNSGSAKGSTGRPVAMIMQFLLERAA